MADSTLRITFQEMQRRVAEYLGIAPRSGGVSVVPTNANDLALVKQLVNDGYRRFITDNEKWNFLNVPLSITFYAQQSLTVTAKTATTLEASSIANVYANDYFNGFEATAVDEDTGITFVYTVTDYVGATGTFTFAAVDSSLEAGDTLKISGPRNVEGLAFRYYLPDDFYGLWKLPLVYDTDGPRIRIIEVTEEQIREMRAGSLTTGDAVYSAFRPINTTATSDGKRWEALFWPEPSATHTVSGIYRRFPALLSANGDVSVAGFHHDNTVLAAALAAAELLRNDTIGVHEATYQQRLVTSKKLDARSSPASTGTYGDNSDGQMYRRPTSDARPTSYNGTDV